MPLRHINVHCLLLILLNICVRLRQSRCKGNVERLVLIFLNIEKLLLKFKFFDILIKL